MDSLRAAVRIARMELRLYLREPSAFFFTLVFPLLLMLLFGSIWGNEPFPDQHFGYIDFATPAFIGIVLLTAGIMNLVISVAVYREKGILRRFRATPVRPVAFLAGQMATMLIVTSLGVVLLLLAGVLVFDLHLWGNPLELFVAFLLTCAAIAGLGFVPASLAPNARTGTVIANVLYFPMLFLSGAALPRQMLPDFLLGVSEVFPLTHGIRLMQELWLGGSLGDDLVEPAVLLAFALAGGVVAARTFRWD